MRIIFLTLFAYFEYDTLINENDVNYPVQIKGIFSFLFLFLFMARIKFSENGAGRMKTETLKVFIRLFKPSNTGNIFVQRLAQQCCVASLGRSREKLLTLIFL